MAIAEYLKKKKLKKAVYSVSCEQTTKMLESKGFTCKTGVSQIKFLIRFSLYLIGVRYLFSCFVVARGRLR